MTTEEVEKIIEDRLNKVVEDANNEFKGQFVIKASSCYGSQEFKVMAETFYKPAEDYTKEELVKMIKDTLLLIQEKISCFDLAIYFLNDENYVKKNEKKLKEINFGMALETAKDSLEATKLHFMPIMYSIFQDDDKIGSLHDWRIKYNTLGADLYPNFDVAKFLRGNNE